MTRLPKLRAAPAAVLAIALIGSLALAVSPAAAGLLEPPAKRVYFGVSDTGDPALLHAVQKFADRNSQGGD